MADKNEMLNPLDALTSIAAPEAAYASTTTTYDPPIDEGYYTITPKGSETTAFLSSGWNPSSGSSAYLWADSGSKSTYTSDQVFYVEQVAKATSSEFAQYRIRPLVQMSNKLCLAWNSSHQACWSKKSSNADATVWYLEESSGYFHLWAGNAGSKTKYALTNAGTANGTQCTIVKTTSPAKAQKWQFTRMDTEGSLIKLATGSSFASTSISAYWHRCLLLYKSSGKLVVTSADPLNGKESGALDGAFMITLGKNGSWSSTKTNYQMTVYARTKTVSSGVAANIADSLSGTYITVGGDQTTSAVSYGCEPRVGAKITVTLDAAWRTNILRLIVKIWNYASSTQRYMNYGTVYFCPDVPINYYENKGSGSSDVKGSIAAQHKYIGEYLRITREHYRRAGYWFTGWNTASAGTGNVVSPGQMLEANALNLTQEPIISQGWDKINDEPANYIGANNWKAGTYVESPAGSGKTSLDLYAQWSPITYELAFSRNKPSKSDIASSDVDMDNITCTYDVSRKLPANTFACQYTLTLSHLEPASSSSSSAAPVALKFTGWNLADDGSSTAIANKAAELNRFSVPYKKERLYAQWQNPTVTLPSPSGSGSTASLAVNGTTYIYDADKFIFRGWGTSDDGWLATASSPAYAAGAKVTLAASKTLYARWTPLEKAIYHVDGKVVSTVSSATYPTYAIASAAAAWYASSAGLSLWYLDASFTSKAGSSYSFASVASQPATLNLYAYTCSITIDYYIDGAKAHTQTSAADGIKLNSAWTLASPQADWYDADHTSGVQSWYTTAACTTKAKASYTWTLPTYANRDIKLSVYAKTYKWVVKYYVDGVLRYTDGPKDMAASYTFKDGSQWKRDGSTGITAWYLDASMKALAGASCAFEQGVDKTVNVYAWSSCKVRYELTDETKEFFAAHTPYSAPTLATKADLSMMKPADVDEVVYGTRITPSWTGRTTSAYISSFPQTRSTTHVNGFFKSASASFSDTSLSSIVVTGDATLYIAWTQPVYDGVQTE